MVVSRVAGVKVGIWWCLVVASCVWGISATAVQGQTRSSRETARTPPQRDATPYRRQYAERRTRFLERLQELETRFQAEGREARVSAVQAAAGPFQPDLLRVRDLPRGVQSTNPADLPDEVREWLPALRQERREYAQDLFALSQKVLGGGI